MNNKRELCNILIVSLDEQFCKCVSSVLASKLDMFFANCKDLIEYDLINPEDVLNKCGLEYLKKREMGVINSCADYNNTIICINYDLFKEYFYLFNKSVIIYLALPIDKIENSINEIAFDKRNDFAKKNSDLNVYVDKKSKAYIQD